MKTRCRMLLQFFALLLALALVASPAAFGATGNVSGADEVDKLSVLNVEDKVDCTISYLRVEKEIDVPDDFKMITGFVEEIKGLAGPDGLIPIDTPELNVATNNIVKQVCNTLLGRDLMQQYKEIVVAILGNVDDVSAEYCEMWEAYEERLEPTVTGKDGDYDPVIPDPDPDPEGWIYYGKPYDLDVITARATTTTKSTNGVLFLSDETIQMTEGWYDSYGNSESPYDWWYDYEGWETPGHTSYDSPLCRLWIWRIWRIVGQR